MLHVGMFEIETRIVGVLRSSSYSVIKFHNDRCLALDLFSPGKLYLGLGFLLLMSPVLKNQKK